MRTETKKVDEKTHSNGYERDDFVISDNDGNFAEETEDDGEDAFEPIREAGVVKSARKRQLGPPITVDHKLERLNPTHRMVVDDFMIHAKRECEKVCISMSLYCAPEANKFQVMIDRSLRAQPFTDSILREMAINFPKGKSQIIAPGRWLIPSRPKRVARDPGYRSGQNRALREEVSEVDPQRGELLRAHDACKRRQATGPKPRERHQHQ